MADVDWFKVQSQRSGAVDPGFAAGGIVRVGGLQRGERHPAMSQRRTHSAEFKARVALEVVKGLTTVNEIAWEYEGHRVQDRAIMPRSCDKAGKSGH